MVKALKQLVCPQSPIHGWLGMVLYPMVYALLEPNPFAGPGNVICWLISVIVDAHSQLEYAKRDKSEDDDNDVSK